MKPRRWTLRAVGNTAALRRGLNAAVEGPEIFNIPLVPVREDCITEADIEVVAIWLFEQELPSERVTSAEWNWANDSKVADDFRDRAQSLLARIFEGGEQS